MLYHLRIPILLVTSIIQGLSCLVKAGLIIRKNGTYFLSSLGKIVYEAQILIGKGIENFWKLKAIDSIELSPDSPRSPAEEHKRIIDTLVDRNDIKDILLDHNNKILVTQKEKVYNSQELITLNPRVCDSIHHFSRMHALKGYLKQLG